jgi:hypothetical protein
MAEPTPGMTHEDSIDTQDPRNQEEKKTKSRRPASEESLDDLRMQRRLGLTFGSFLQTLRFASND